MNKARQTYIEVMAEFAESTIMQQIIRDIRNDPTYILPKFSDDLGDEIRQSEYPLS
jgi:hypothetical protein